jgi:hypothetical protein
MTPDMTRLVAPLVWECGDNITRSVDCFEAVDGFGGLYTVVDGQWRGSEKWVSCENTEAAKAAAQADYAARIIAALDPAALAAILALIDKEPQT